MATESAGPKVQEIGCEVLDFTLGDLQGVTRRLGGELENQAAAVVVFWSCVCSHCLRYDEYLNSFRERHPNVALLAVASRQQETPDELRRAARERGLAFPILIDPGGRLARQWFTEQTPRVFLIAADNGPTKSAGLGGQTKRAPNQARANDRDLTDGHQGNGVIESSDH